MSMYNSVKSMAIQCGGVVSRDMPRVHKNAMFHVKQIIDINVNVNVEFKYSFKLNIDIKSLEIVVK